MEKFQGWFVCGDPLRQEEDRPWRIGSPEGGLSLSRRICGASVVGDQGVECLFVEVGRVVGVGRHGIEGVQFRETDRQALGFDGGHAGLRVFFEDVQLNVETCRNDDKHRSRDQQFAPQSSAFANDGLRFPGAHWNAI